MMNICIMAMKTRLFSKIRGLEIKNEKDNGNDFTTEYQNGTKIIFRPNTNDSSYYVKLSNGIIDNQCIKCSKHGSKFDLKTGEALNLPAVAPIQIYKIKIEDGFVYIFEE